jgi:hypothetical protein
LADDFAGGHGDLEYADDAVMALDGFEMDIGAGEDEGAVAGGIALADVDPSDMALGDWLAAAR